MPIATAANVRQDEASHYYWPDGRPAYTFPKVDGSGDTPTTIRHARKHLLLPSVTTILKILEKPALTAWKIEQAVNAVLTSPRVADEPLDAFVSRVLGRDREQEQEMQKARDLGTDIHDALENMVSGKTMLVMPDAMQKPVEAAYAECRKFGRCVWAEKVLTGTGYAGRADCLFEDENAVTLVDFKTTKKLPKASYDEHKLQLSAYAKTLGNTGNKLIRTANIYISTSEPWLVSVDVHSNWEEAYENGFKPLQRAWCWLNDYYPT